MKTTKNIDRLFQEKLKDLEVSPPASVWKGVESNLHQKNSKRVLPLWFRMSGAAAILLLLTLGGVNYFDKISNDIIITDSNDIENTPVNENGILNPAINDSNKSNSVVTEVIQNNNAAYETLKVDNTQTRKQIQFNSTPKNSIISEVSTFSNSKNDLEKLSGTSLSTKSTVALIDKNKSNNTKIISSKEKFTQKLLKFNKTEENSNSEITSELTNSDSKSNTQSIFNTNKNAITQSKEENFEEKYSVESNLDTIQKTVLKTEEEVAFIPNKYDDLLNSDMSEDIKEKEEEESAKKWSIASSIAPIYYNTFNTKGSPLDLQFKDSPKTGSKSVAYGVKIGYRLNDKLTLQSGVSKIDVGYKIGNVFINPTSQLEGKLTNVNYTNTATILNVNAKSFIDDVFLETNSNSALTGELNQSFGYIEIPLELKYTLTNTSKKLGVNLIGGLSTLLLNKNEVFVSTSEFSSNLGEANNLNKVNFSGNIGFDIDYKINKKIYINVAPMLKIHTKTFSNSGNNFEPYLFGVYTGINYRF
jgi:hypothetical protein|tara:strand:+ start:907 stop:2496 length:1590 start_codon:yes stop_codon:yes gene_type:complete